MEVVFLLAAEQDFKRHTTGLQNIAGVKSKLSSPKWTPG